MLLVTLATALAGWPEDLTLSGLTEHDGVRVVDNELLQSTWRELVMELGTAIAPRPMPSATTGIYGFELALSSSFVLVDAKTRPSRVTPWDRAVADENHEPYLAIPTFSVRKGLPGSFELGGRLGWLAGTRTGLGSVYGRLAVLENYKPIPDVTLQLGYTGYTGNDEFDLSVFDMGVTVGSRFGIGRNGENNGRFEPFAKFDLLRISAAPTAPLELVQQVGAVTYERNQLNAELPLAVPRIGAGFQVTSGVAHFRLSGSWSWLTIPSIDVGMGFTF
ncbi:MAG: hypothetical protein H6734_18055 [Alphaproteobacteria bacterium]|nr:hypothetical protein [Alphaproteobacteria bacterium]